MNKKLSRWKINLIVIEILILTIFLIYFVRTIEDEHKRKNIINIPTVKISTDILKQVYLPTQKELDKLRQKKLLQKEFEFKLDKKPSPPKKQQKDFIFELE